MQVYFIILLLPFYSFLRLVFSTQKKAHPSQGALLRLLRTSCRKTIFNTKLTPLYHPPPKIKQTNEPLGFVCLPQYIIHFCFVNRVLPTFFMIFIFFYK